MRLSAEKRIKGLFERVGLDLRRTATGWPLDFTDTSDIEPIEAAHISHGREFLVRVPLDRCLHFEWLAFSSDRTSDSPFVRTSLQYAQGNCKTYANSPLEKFYAVFRPESAAEIMGIESPSCETWREVPPGGAVKFWQGFSPSEKAQDRKRLIADENRLHGAGFGLSDGDHLYGPVSPRKGELEFLRLIRAFESVKAKGLRIDREGKNNIGVVCLYDASRGDWKCLVFPQGNHRIATLAALGYEDVVVQMTAVSLGGLVCREHARHWPVVRNGYLGAAEAQMVFDRLLAGGQPASAERWMSLCREEPIQVRDVYGEI